MIFYFRLDSNIKNIYRIAAKLAFSFFTNHRHLFHAIVYTTGRRIKMNHNFVIIFLIASIPRKTKKFNFNDVEATTLASLYSKF